MGKTAKKIGNILGLIFFFVSVHAQIMQLPVPNEEGRYTTHSLFLKNFNPGSSQIPVIPSPFPPAGGITQGSSVSLQAVYVPPTVQSIKRILDKYKSIPGGITLEGNAEMETLRTIQYVPEKNVFIINGNLIYDNRLPFSETKEIFKAIDTNDLIGVSLGDEDVIYGSLLKGSLPSIFMKLSDHYLGSIVFACGNWMDYKNFPGGYIPERDLSTGGVYAVYFNLGHYVFKTDHGKLIPKGANMEITLIPLTDQKEENGSYVPDYVRIEKKDISKAFENNSRHIASYIEDYSKEPRLQKVIEYGRIAALARTIKASGIELGSVIR